MSAKMRGFTITDRDARNVLSFDLKDILALTGKKGLLSVWKLADVEAVGADAIDEMHSLSDRNAFVAGARLKELSLQITQVIDGQFQGSVDSKAEPWIIIRAVDSGAFDVITNDDKVCRKLQERFSEISDISQMI